MFNNLYIKDFKYNLLLLIIFAFIKKNINKCY
jgi:hypothetical protein